jgi:hypothetical protein
MVTNGRSGLTEEASGSNTQGGGSSGSRHERAQCAAMAGGSVSTTGGTSHIFGGHGLIQGGRAYENGLVERAHRRIKSMRAQALLLRGSCDFRSVKEYEHWLRLVLEREYNSQVWESGCLKRGVICGRCQRHRFLSTPKSKWWCRWWHPIPTSAARSDGCSPTRWPSTMRRSGARRPRPK